LANFDFPGERAQASRLALRLTLRLAGINWTGE
jgi:hypothetical protein